MILSVCFSPDKKLITTECFRISMNRFLIHRLNEDFEVSLNEVCSLKQPCLSFKYQKICSIISIQQNLSRAFFLVKSRGQPPVKIGVTSISRHTLSPEREKASKYWCLLSHLEPSHYGTGTSAAARSVCGAMWNNWGELLPGASHWSQWSESQRRAARSSCANQIQLPVMNGFAYYE